jgi:hypothetical protein
MRSYQAVALYLNGFYLLSLVPTSQQPGSVSLINAQHILGNSDLIAEDLPATELGVEYFPDAEHYRKLVRSLGENHESRSWELMQSMMHIFDSQRDD